jgi:hypothetical protein
MLAMEVNDDAGSLTPRGALRFFASMLAPTVRTKPWGAVTAEMDMYTAPPLVR